MNRWSGVSRNINLCLWQKSKRILHWIRIALLIEAHSDRSTTEHETKDAEQLEQYLLAFHAPFFRDRILSHITLLLPTWNICRSSHSSKGIQQNQTANSEVDVTINLKCGLRRTKKPNICTECSLPRKEQAHQTLSARGFFMGYVHWVNENHCYLRRHISVI